MAHTTPVAHPRVFILYSRESAEINDKVYSLARRLRKKGIDVDIDQYHDSPQEGWQRWMETQIDKSEFVLVLCTRTLLEKQSLQPAPQDVTPDGAGVRWEAGFMYDYLYTAADHTKFIPVVFDKGDLQFRPKPLYKATYYNLSDTDSEGRLYRRLTGQPERPKPPLGNILEMPPADVQEEHVEPLEEKARRDAFVDQLELITSYSDAVCGLVCQTTNIKDESLVDRPTAWIRLEEAFLNAFRQSMRFLIRFYGAPTGLRVAVRNRSTRGPTASPIEVVRVQGANPNGEGGELVAEKEGIWEIPLDDDRNGYIVYQVVYNAGLQPAELDIPLVFGWSPESGEMPSAGSLQVSATQCPLSSEVPRPVGYYPDFGGDPHTICSLVNCTTALLFPYVSNRSGFDTGIAISNTSAASPFRIWPQRGRVMILFHGHCEDGKTPDAQVSAIVEAGEQLTFTLSQGNPIWEIEGAPGFQGFIVAMCEFQPAHGFATLTDATSPIPNFAQGYLAEVMGGNPDPRGEPEKDC